MKFVSGIQILFLVNTVLFDLIIITSGYIKSEIFSSITRSVILKDNLVSNQIMFQFSNDTSHKGRDRHVYPR